MVGMDGRHNRWRGGSKIINQFEKAIQSGGFAPDAF